MNTEKILETVLEAKKEGILEVDDYFSSSTGEVFDFAFEIIGREGYLKIVSTSKNQLLDMEKPEHIAAEVWMTAKEQQLQSWERTLSGETSGRKSPDYIPVDGDCVFETKDEVPFVVVKHLRIIRKTAVATEKPAATKQKKQSDIALAKEFIRKNTAMGMYVGQINLGNGKFTSIRNVKH
jgi:hypothetical protein